MGTMTEDDYVPFWRLLITVAALAFLPSTGQSKASAD